MMHINDTTNVPYIYIYIRTKGYCDLSGKIDHVEELDRNLELTQQQI